MPRKKEESAKETAPQPVSGELVITEGTPEEQQRQVEHTGYVISRRLREARERGEEIGPRPQPTEPTESEGAE